jgi:hypothetical protein
MSELQAYTDTIEERIIYTCGNIAMQRAITTASKEPTQEEIWLGEALDALLKVKQELGLSSQLKVVEP